MSAFPVIKLFSLFTKQLSKPVANYIKQKSIGNYWIRTYICIPPAQLHHRFDVRLRLWISGTKRNKNQKIPRLDEKRAIKEGADLLGELFILSVAIGLVALEYHRQSVNAALKDEQQDTSLIRLTRDMKKLREQLQEQCDDVEELIRLVEVFEGKPIKFDDSSPVTKLPKR